MRRVLAASGLALLVCGTALSLIAVPASETEAASVPSPQTFVVPAADGYGIADCVSSGSSCGQVVADAWCEAQGFARSASFGPADVETTGSLSTAGRPISVTCAP